MSNETLFDQLPPVLQDLAQVIIEGNKDAAVSLIQKGLEEDIEALTIIEKSMTPATREDGKRLGRLELLLSEMDLSAEAMQAGMKILEPHFEKGGGPVNQGTIIIGTVKNDIHDIGKNIFSALLRVNGYLLVNKPYNKSILTN